MTDLGLGRVVGFTGTSDAVTVEQDASLVLVLRQAKAEGADRILNGLCVGADELAAVHARGLGLRVIGLPGRERGMPGRSLFNPDSCLAVPTGRDPELTRNRRLARACSGLIACPSGFKMTTRSGTWATVRYALATRRPVVVVFPDGRVARAEAEFERGRVKNALFPTFLRVVGDDEPAATGAVAVS